MDTQDFNSENPYGSARWANRDDIRRAGLFGGQGLQQGYWGRKPLENDSDAPVLVCAGSGSGKSRDLFVPMLCRPDRGSWVVLDPRGELYQVSMLRLAEQGIYAYCLNLMPEAGGIPRHSCNPLDILRPDCPALFENTEFLIGGLIAKPIGRSEPYFANRARDWAQDLTISRVEHFGETSLPDLYRTINLIEGDQEGWEAQLEVMLNSRFESVRKTAKEMFIKQNESPKEFSGIMGEIYNALAPLKSPQVRTMLESGFSLSELADGVRPVRLHVVFPAEFLASLAPIVRVIFQSVMLYKGRRPDTPRVTLLADESAQLKKFDGLQTAMSYSRGQGVRTIAVFQDIGQIATNYGEAAIKTFLGNAETKLFFGVRDYGTAQLISNMLGQTTNHVHDPRQQEEARRSRMKIMREVVDGRDPFEAAYEYRHYGEAAKRPNKQARPLMTPAEILNLPANKAIAMISGRDLPPILQDKYPYYSREAAREMNLRYLPNPSHAPTDRVRLWKRFGSDWVKVKRVSVPEKLAHIPQFASGERLVLEGYSF